MTRGMFFKLIAGLWAGQATQSTPIEADSGWCLDAKTLTAKPCACKPGEERCPLSHCQKPRYVVIEGRIVDVPEQEVEHHPAQSWNDVPFNSGGEVIPEWHIPAFDTYKTNLHICAVCGVCYVPPSSK